MRSAWDDLVTATTIGIDSATALPAAVGDDRPPLPGPPGDSTSGGVGPAAALAAAALLHAARRGGLGPGGLGPGEPDPQAHAGGGASCPTAPEHPGQGVRLMPLGVAGRMLGHPPVVATELAGVAARAGLVVPAEALAGWVAAASRDVGFAVAAAPVLGARGCWLAALNPAWRTAAMTVDQSLDAALADQVVDRGGPARVTPAQRVAWFARARREEPAAAREGLERAFRGLAPPARAALLAELRAGLGPADAPFLTAAGEDRASGVREVAAALLAALAELGARVETRRSEASATLAGCAPGEHRRAAAAIAALVAAGAEPSACGVVDRFAHLPPGRPVTAVEHPADELAAWPGPWPRPLAEAAFAHVEARMRTGPPDGGDRRAAQFVALRADPDWLRPRLADVLALTPVQSRWRPVLLVAADLTDLCHRLEQEPS